MQKKNRKTKTRIGFTIAVNIIKVSWELSYSFTNLLSLFLRVVSTILFSISSKIILDHTIRIAITPKILPLCAHCQARKYRKKDCVTETSSQWQQTSLHHTYQGPLRKYFLRSPGSGMVGDHTKMYKTVSVSYRKLTWSVVLYTYYTYTVHLLTSMVYTLSSVLYCTYCTVHVSNRQSHTTSHTSHSHSRTHETGQGEYSTIAQLNSLLTTNAYTRFVSSTTEWLSWERRIDFLALLTILRG